MSENEEAILDSGNEHHGKRTYVPQQSSDLADTFGLFRSYLDTSLASFKSELIESQDAKVQDISRKLKKDVSSTMKSERNRIQFDFNEDLLSDLDKLSKRLTRRKDENSQEFVTKISEKIRKRNKLIRIADSSPAGWATVKQYESSEIASDSDDEKKLRQAENIALRSIKEKRRNKPYDRIRGNDSNPAFSAAAGSAQQLRGFRYQTSFQSNQPFRTRRQANPWDVCYACRGMGHWRKDCPATNQSDPQTSSSNISSGTK